MADIEIRCGSDLNACAQEGFDRVRAVALGNELDVPIIFGIQLNALGELQRGRLACVEHAVSQKTFHRGSNAALNERKSQIGAAARSIGSGAIGEVPLIPFEAVVIGRQGLANRNFHGLNDFAVERLDRQRSVTLLLRPYGTFAVGDRVARELICELGAGRKSHGNDRVTFAERNRDLIGNERYTVCLYQLEGGRLILSVPVFVHAFRTFNTLNVIAELIVVHAVTVYTVPHGRGAGMRLTVLKHAVKIFYGILLEILFYVGVTGPAASNVGGHDDTVVFEV